MNKSETGIMGSDDDDDDGQGHSWRIPPLVLKQVELRLKEIILKTTSTDRNRKMASKVLKQLMKQRERQP